MDITSLVGPVLRLVGATSNHNHNHNTNSPIRGIMNHHHGMNNNASNNGTLDRTLGAAATLGITVALYRFLTTSPSSPYSDSYHHPNTATNNNNNSNETNNNQSTLTTTKKRVVTIPVTLLHSFLQIILKGFFEKQQRRITTTTTTTPDDDNNDCFVVQPTYDNDMNTNILNHRGFCHCRSISFSLKAPKQIIAKESRQGRIRYPHYNTTEDQFQLHPESNEYMSIYYTKRIHPKNTIAAHAFCQRCGVHILRAPDSNSFQLQINVNCLSLHPSNIKIIPYTTTSTNETSREEEIVDLDAGIALEQQWNHHHSNCEEESYVQGKHGYVVKSNLHKSIFESSSFPGTPSTTATTVSPLQESLLPPLSTDGYVDDQDNDDNDENDDVGLTWDPSTIIDSNPNKEDETTMNLEGSLATFATRDQLKYFMKKHLRNETDS